MAAKGLDKYRGLRRKLTSDEIADLLYLCGFPLNRATFTFEGDNDLVHAVRIVMGESGGNPLAHNPASTAWGLFQILRGTRPGISDERAKDPVVNAQVAFQVYSKQNGFRVGHSAWNYAGAHTLFHTLRLDSNKKSATYGKYIRDTSRITASRAAVARLVARIENLT